MGKILIVDDSFNMRQIVHDVATSIGHTTTTLACGGVEGLEKFKEFNPDLIVTDRQMPNMDGVALASEIKKLDPKASIILFTGWSQDVDHSLFIQIVSKDDLNGLEAAIRGFFEGR